MGNETRKYPQDLLNLKQRRLRILEQQAAQRGTNTPPEIIIEIEDLRVEIQFILSQTISEASEKNITSSLEEIAKTRDDERLSSDIRTISDYSNQEIWDLMKFAFIVHITGFINGRVGGWVLFGGAAIIMIGIDRAKYWGLIGSVLGSIITPAIFFAYLCLTYSRYQFGYIIIIISAIAGFVAGLVVGGSQDWMVQGTVYGSISIFCAACMTLDIDKVKARKRNRSGDIQ